MFTPLILAIIAVLLLGFPQVQRWLGKLVVGSLYALAGLAVGIWAAAEFGEDGFIAAFCAAGIGLVLLCLATRATTPRRRAAGRPVHHRLRIEPRASREVSTVADLSPR